MDMEEKIKKAQKEIQPLYDKFVVDHAAFVEQWTKENIQLGQNIVGLGALASGLGASAGIFCSSMAKTMAIHPKTLREMIVVQLDKQIGPTVVP